MAQHSMWKECTKFKMFCPDKLVPCKQLLFHEQLGPHHSSPEQARISNFTGIFVLGKLKREISARSWSSLRLSAPPPPETLHFLLAHSGSDDPIQGFIQPPTQQIRKYPQARLNNPPQAKNKNCSMFQRCIKRQKSWKMGEKWIKINFPLSFCM